MNFKFSVIIPIYNVEDYIEETILSIINQTINFENNIQIIFVNDGSPDNSKDICLKYVNKYPNNIIYIEQENSGVSLARNNGLKYAIGEIITFLDSDDKWQNNAFEVVYNFFKENKDKIDVVACPLEYFEAKEGLSHPLNFKFKGNKIIDIKYSPECIQMHMASCFIKANAINIEFDTKLKYAEDSLFINKIILYKQKYGIVSNVHYMYRKRENGSSALDVCQTKNNFYNNTLKNFHLHLLEYCKQIYSKVPRYVQYIIMYDLQWRIKRKILENVLTKQEKKLYIDYLKIILKEIEDFIIVSQKELSLEHKLYALSLKYDQDITEDLIPIKDNYFFNNLLLFSSKNKILTRISLLKIKHNTLFLEGIVNTPIDVKNYKVFILDQFENKYNLDLIDYVKQEKVCVEGHYYYNKYFKIKIPLIKNNILKLKFYFKYKDNAPTIIDLGNTNTCQLNTSMKGNYVKFDNNIVEYKKNQIIVRNNSKKLHYKLEKQYTKVLKNNNLKKLIIYRWIKFFLYYLIKKDIWLVMDRPDKAGDNGEAFFKYLQTINNKKIKSYFVINKDSEDYNKMKKIGKVVKYGSKKYKILFLLSSKIISSQASDYIINAFGKNHKYMKDLYGFDFIFLQHGITKDDISTWLNKASKKIDLFITAGIPEYQSIINGNYYYDSSIVKLTGFSRHDNLVHMNKKTKQIAIVPTWRKSIPNCIDVKTDKSIYNDNFNQTEFFKFYNTLINDERLINIMKHYEYTGIFCLHPLFVEQYKHFKENDIIKVNKGYVNYQELFATNDLLVTDYSSLFFDFGYLNKPIVYCHFDKKEFFEGHSYDEGYFSYENDGFGPVSYDLNSTINEIIKMIQEDCKLDDKYKQRIDAFYPLDRGNNSKKIYEEIIKM